MKKITYRRWQILLTFISFLVLFCSFYFEYLKNLQPCPLCLMQRWTVACIFFLCFLGVFIKIKKIATFLAVLQLVFASAGLFFVGRQLWLQSLAPGQAPACMPDFDVLIKYFPWSDVLHALFWGAGDCAEVSWQWAGLSMPAWAGVYFLIMAVAAILSFYALRRYTKSLQV